MQCRRCSVQWTPQPPVSTGCMGLNRRRTAGTAAASDATQEHSSTCCQCPVFTPRCPARVFSTDLQGIRAATRPSMHSLLRPPPNGPYHRHDARHHRRQEHARQYGKGDGGGVVAGGGYGDEGAGGGGQGGDGHVQCNQLRTAGQGPRSESGSGILDMTGPPQSSNRPRYGWRLRMTTAMRWCIDAAGLQHGKERLSQGSQPTKAIRVQAPGTADCTHRAVQGSPYVPQVWPRLTHGYHVV